MNTEQELTNESAEALLRLMNERAALSRAFRAHTGLHPNDAVLCQRVDEQGVVRTWYERRAYEVTPTEP